jgi:hypothetical protein
MWGADSIQCESDAPSSGVSLKPSNHRKHRSITGQITTDCGEVVKSGPNKQIGLVLPMWEVIAPTDVEASPTVHPVKACFICGGEPQGEHV